MINGKYRKNQNERDGTSTVSSIETDSNLDGESSVGRVKDSPREFSIDSDDISSIVDYVLAHYQDDRTDGTSSVDTEESFHTANFDGVVLQPAKVLNKELMAASAPFEGYHDEFNFVTPAF